MTEKINYILHLADNALILGQRNSEWCGKGPILEQDIALTNITLDLIGQARNFYTYAAELIQTTSGQPVTEDTLAYQRDVREFKNCLLVEQPNGDWAETIMRQFLFSNFQYFLFRQLLHSADSRIGAIAEKSLKEVTYHVRWSSEWVIRLGDGTAQSNQKITRATENLWRYAGELGEPSEYEFRMTREGIGADLTRVNGEFLGKVAEVFREATLAVPGETAMQSGGKNGLHTEYLGYILAEMQFLQRAYPNCDW